MKFLSILLLALFFPHFTAAQQLPQSQRPRQAFSFADGSKVLQFCESNETADAMWCAGYISAAASAAQYESSSLKICLPSNVNIKRLTDMVVKFIKDHPEKRHFDAFALAVVAWSPFACSPEKQK